MVLALNTLMWHDLPLAEALAAAARAGVTTLDLGATTACPHVDPLHFDAKQVLPQLEGYRVAAVTADHPGMPCLEEDGGDDAVDHTVAAIRAARALGARVVSISLGSTGVDAWDMAWTRATNALKMILHRTANSGARIAVELHADDVLNSQKRLRRLLEEIPNPRLGVTLDTGYLYYLRIPVSALLEITGDRLYHVHLRDATRTDPYRAIGHGEVHFPAVFRTLKAHGYTGALSLELYRTEQQGLTIDQAVAEAIPKLQEWLVEV